MRLDADARSATQTTKPRKGLVGGMLLAFLQRRRVFASPESVAVRIDSPTSVLLGMMFRPILVGGGAGALLLAFESAWMAAQAPALLGYSRSNLFAFVATALALAAVIGASAGILAFLTANAVRRLAVRAARDSDRFPWWAGLFGATATTPVWFYLVACALSGRQARMAGQRELLVAALVTALVASSAIILRMAILWCRRDRGAPSRRAAITATVVLAALTAALMIGDRLILPHHYGWFHHSVRGAAFATTFISLLMLTRSMGRTLGRRRRFGRWDDPVTALVALAGCSVLAVTISGRLHRSPPGLRQLTYVHGALSDSLTELSDRWALGWATRWPQTAPELSPPSLPTALSEDLGSPLSAGANVLLITVDALRADHLGLYGHRRSTSPNLDALAHESVVFDRAYATTPHTSFSLASLLIGRPAMTLSRLRDLQNKRTLADHARSGGYQTAAFFPPAVFFVDPEHFRSYESSKYGFDYVEYQQWPEATSAKDISDRALKYFTEARPTRFCVWLHYFAPHEPYVDHSERGIPSFGSAAVDRYDGEIRWVDREIGRLLDFVRREYPRTVIVMTADHGEEFGEHGGSYHGTTLFDEQIHVPLLVHVPGHPPARVAVPASTIDVLPTVLSLVGLAPDPSLPGRNLAQGVASRGSGYNAWSPDHLAPVFAENNDLKMVVAGHHKLVCNVRRDLCTLYDLDEDPKEQRDLSGSRPEVYGKLEKLLRGWLVGEPATGRAAVGSSSTDVPAGLRRGLLADRSAIPELLSLLTDHESPVERKRDAARAVAQLVDLNQPLHEKLRAIYTDNTEPSVRAWIAVALARLGDWDPAATTFDRLQGFTAVDRQLPAQVAIALARAGYGDAQTFGRLLAETDNVLLRCGLMDALVRIGGKQAVPELIRSYDDVRSRPCAANALRRLASADTLPFILSRLVDEPYVSVQVELLRALARIGGPEYAALIRKVAATSDDPLVSTAATEILREFDERPRRRPPASPPRRLSLGSQPRAPDSATTRSTETPAPPSAPLQERGDPTGG